jgi:hypothetical protein
MKEELKLNYALHFPDIMQNEDEFKLLKKTLANLITTFPCIEFTRMQVMTLYIAVTNLWKEAHIEDIMYDGSDVNVRLLLKRRKYIALRIDKLYSDFEETDFEGLARFFNLIKEENG